MSDQIASQVLQNAVRRDRQQRMGLRVGEVTATTRGAAHVNFGRDTDVQVPTGSDVGTGTNLLVLQIEGALMPLGNVSVMMGTPNPPVESIP